MTYFLMNGHQLPYQAYVIPYLDGLKIRVSPVQVRLRPPLKVLVDLSLRDLLLVSNLELCGNWTRNYNLFISKAKEAYKSSRENFIKHFKKKYGESHDLPPYWVLVEIIDFGQMYRLYQGAPKPIQKKIARKLGLEPVILDSWLKALNVCRNICAHHARLWNKVLGIKPKIPERDERWQNPQVSNDRIFAVLTILSYSLNIIAPNSSWQSKLIDLFHKHPNIPITNMGFLSRWEESPFWKMQLDRVCTKVSEDEVFI